MGKGGNYYGLYRILDDIIEMREKILVDKTDICCQKKYNDLIMNCIVVFDNTKAKNYINVVEFLSDILYDNKSQFKDEEYRLIYDKLMDIYNLTVGFVNYIDTYNSFGLYKKDIETLIKKLHNNVDNKFVVSFPLDYMSMVSYAYRHKPELDDKHTLLWNDIMIFMGSLFADLRGF
jgi:hypothetical protein